MLDIRLQGKPCEMGETVGRSYPLAIFRVAAESLRRYHTAYCDLGAMRRALDRRMDTLGELYPEGYQYLQGLSEGSTIPLWKLALVNVGLAAADQAALGLSEPSEEEPSPSPQCTLAGFQNAPEGPLVGGNLDDPEWHFLSFEQPAEGYRCLQVRLPGYYMTWGGMNEHGLSITGASGGPALPGTPDAQPSPEVPALSWSPVQDILYRCRTTAEALELIRQPQYAGNNYMIGDTEEVVQVEKRFDGVTVQTFREPEDAPLCGGNLRRSDFGQPWYEKHLPDLLPSFLARHRLVLRLMETHRHAPSVESLKAVLNHHGGGREDVEAAHSLCHTGSALTLIGVPRRKYVLIGEAPACINGYREYSLEEVLD